MMKQIKDKFPNIYIIIAGLCVACWFRGVNMIISQLVTKETLTIGLMLIVVSMIILYLDDGSLREIRNIAAAQNYSK